MTTCVTPAVNQHLALINQARTQAGVLPLRVSAILHAAAHKKAQQMASGDWFGHTEPSGRTARQLVLEYGYPANAATGENILYGTGDPVDAFNVWFNSPAHRDNLLSPHYTEVGIALNVEPSWDYGGDVFAVGVQCFGGASTPPARGCHDDAPPPRPPREPKPTLPDERPPREERKAARKAERRQERLWDRLLRRLGVR